MDEVRVAIQISFQRRSDLRVSFSGLNLLDREFLSIGAKSFDFWIILGVVQEQVNVSILSF